MVPSTQQQLEGSSGIIRKKIFQLSPDQLSSTRREQLQRARARGADELGRHLDDGARQRTASDHVENGRIEFGLRGPIDAGPTAARRHGHSHPA